jgi:hypothetical protein
MESDKEVCGVGVMRSLSGEVVKRFFVKSEKKIAMRV